jgi:hypothetical protein
VEGRFRKAIREKIAGYGISQDFAEIGIALPWWILKNPRVSLTGEGKSAAFERI